VIDRKRFLAPLTGAVTAVPAWRATTEERARALSAFQRDRILTDLTRAEARDVLVALFEMATDRDLRRPRDMKDDVLVAAVAPAISSGKLLLISGWDGNARLDGTRGGVDTSPATQLDRVVQTVMGDRSSLDFEGGRYRLVAAQRWTRQRKDGKYTLVPEGQARPLVARMAERLAKTSDERAAWKGVIEAVALQLHGGGLVLTRWAPPVGAPRPLSVAPVTTPSQVHAPVAEQHWIEIKLEYDDGTPFDGNCEVELPDGRRTHGAPDKDGIVRIDGIPPGACKLSLPDMDASAWNA
jgi:hypothetical protein